MNHDPVTRDEIIAAFERLAPVIRETPVLASRVLSERTGRQVWLKCENLQRTGSFKPRGAYNRIANLDPAQRAQGVVAASAGNHAQGVAWAAGALGTDATVFMPENAALPKVVATKAYGGRVHLFGATLAEALEAAADFAADTGAVLIHPFDHIDVVAGQAGVGIEILRQIPDVATILVPTGGGGLVAGIAAAMHHLAPQVRVIGVQAEGAAAWPASLSAGEPVRAQSVSTMADGIAVPVPGRVPFAAVQAYVDTIVTVSEEALSEALLLCLERAKMLVEPAGAAAVAALMTAELDIRGPVCAVLSGGNIDPLVLTHVMNHGLRAAGRYLVIKAVIADRPGGLSGLLNVVSAGGASVLDVVHRRTAPTLGLDEVEVMLTVETRGSAHREAVLAALAEAGVRATVEDDRVS